MLCVLLQVFLRRLLLLMRCIRLRGSQMMLRGWCVLLDQQVDAWNRAATRRTWYGRLKSVDVREFEYAVMDLATVTLRPLRRCARSARIEYAREYHPELLTE